MQLVLLVVCMATYDSGFEEASHILAHYADLLKAVPDYALQAVANTVTALPYELKADNASRFDACTT